MPFFENTTILCRDPYDFDNYSTMKIEIAFMSNLEKPITATAAAWQPGLLDRWDLQGEGQTAPACQNSNIKFQICNTNLTCVKINYLTMLSNK